MSARNLVIQFDERQDADKRCSYNITYVKINDRGAIVSAPIQLWQRETPVGDIPEKLPFVADLQLDVRQFRGKDGNLQTQSYIVAFDNAQPVGLTF